MRQGISDVFFSKRSFFAIQNTSTPFLSVFPVLLNFEIDEADDKQDNEHQRRNCGRVTDFAAEKRREIGQNGERVRCIIRSAVGEQIDIFEVIEGPDELQNDTDGADAADHGHSNMEKGFPKAGAVDMGGFI